MRLSERAKRITENLTGKERLADVISALGIEVTREYKFTLRDERTASCVINNDGTVHDFGDGSHLDFVNVIQTRDGLDFKSAVTKAEEMLGIDDTGNATRTFQTPKLTKAEIAKTQEKLTDPLDEEYVLYFRRQAFGNEERFREFVKKLMPTGSAEQLKKIVKQFEIGYDPKSDRLTIPVRNVKGSPVNLFKYTPYPKKRDDGKEFPKVRYLSKRERVIFNLGILRHAPKTLYILEGEKDVINATLSGKAAITQGAASNWQPWMAKAIVLACKYFKVAIPRIIIIQDHDKAGLKAALKIYKDVKEVQEDTTMVFWQQETADYIGRHIQKDVAVLDRGLPREVVKKGFDYTDYQYYLANKKAS